MFQVTALTGSDLGTDLAPYETFTLGGPLTKDRERTRFLESYEGRRSRTNNIVVSPAALGRSVPDDEDEHLVFFRVDHRPSPNHLLMSRYNGQFLRWHSERGALFDDRTLLVRSAMRDTAAHSVEQTRPIIERRTFFFGDESGNSAHINFGLWIADCGFCLSSASPCLRVSLSILQ